MRPKPKERPLKNAYKPSWVVFELIGLPDRSERGAEVMSILESVEAKNPRIKPTRLLDVACRETRLLDLLGFDPRE